MSSCFKFQSRKRLEHWLEPWQPAHSSEYPERTACCRFAMLRCLQLYEGACFISVNAVNSRWLMRKCVELYENLPPEAPAEVPKAIGAASLDAAQVTQPLLGGLQAAQDLGNFKPNHPSRFRDFAFPRTTTVRGTGRAAQAARRQLSAGR